MSQSFKLEIVNPESSFLTKEEVTEVVVPAFEGDMGILKDHIPIISFLKPGLVKIFEGSNEETYYVDDGIIEFKNNCLSILTSNIFDIKHSDKAKIQEMIKEAENDLSGFTISSLKPSFIMLQLLLPFFQLSQQLHQLFLPYKKQLLANDHIHLCKLHRNL